MKKNQSNIEEAKAKREYLKKISNEVLKKDRELYPEDEGQRANINTLLMAYIYNRNNNLTFHSFAHWLRLGYIVNKGEKAFLLWGQPIKKAKKENPTDEFEFFPLAYVFSSEQVRKIEKEIPAEESTPPVEPEPEPEKEDVLIHSDDFNLF